MHTSTTQALIHSHTFSRSDLRVFQLAGHPFFCGSEVRSRLGRAALAGRKWTIANLTTGDVLMAAVNWRHGIEQRKKRSRLEDCRQFR